MPVNMLCCESHVKGEAVLGVLDPECRHSTLSWFCNWRPDATWGRDATMDGKSVIIFHLLFSNRTLILIGVATVRLTTFPVSRAAKYGVWLSSGIRKISECTLNGSLMGVTSPNTLPYQQYLFSASWNLGLMADTPAAIWDGEVTENGSLELRC